jgi:Cu+-exporting ATPase
MKVTLKISGMHCIDCAWTVERALSRTAGVARAKVSYLKKQADVEVQDGVAVADLVAAVEQAGYGAEVLDGKA